MGNLVIHPRTASKIAAVSVDMPQSLLLTGPSGVGLLSIAMQLASSDLLALLTPQNSKDQTDDAHGSITVESIRGLYTKTRNKRTRRSVVIVDNAERMNTSAQSAFLKLLEEPNEQTYFILTSHQPQLLKTTIRSRTQELTISAVTPAQTDEILANLSVIDSKKQAQLRFIASGLPAEITRLARDDKYFAQRASIVGDARTLLQGDVYAKLLLAQKYHAVRDDALQLIDSTIAIARHTLSLKPQHELVRQLDRLEYAHRQIANNGNIRLQLAGLVLSV